MSDIATFSLGLRPLTFCFEKNLLSFMLPIPCIPQVLLCTHAMDPISLVRELFELMQLAQILSKNYDEFDSRVDLMIAVSKQALIICRTSKSSVPDEMQDLCAIIEKKCTAILSELQEWKCRFKDEGMNKKLSSLKRSYIKIKAQTRLPKLAEDLNDMALHANR